MSNISIVYLSNTGNTEAMAEILKAALDAKGKDVSLQTVEEAKAEEVKASPVIVLGCPACGTEELDDQIITFMQDLGDLSGKKLAIFGSFGWGDGEYQEDWQETLKSAGAEMIGAVAALESPDDEAETNLKDLADKIAGA